MNRLASFVMFLVPIAACGGDDGGPTSVPTEILPASTYQDRCETPRTGTDIQGNKFPDQSGNLLAEQLFLRSWIDDTYLWYSEVPGANPQMFDNTLDYFAILKTGVFTASGKAKDQFTSRR